MQEKERTKYEPTESYNTNEEFRKDVTGRSMNVIRSSNGIIAINSETMRFWLFIRLFCSMKDIYVEKRDFFSAKDATVTFN